MDKIKKSHDYGECYNRESMYETAREQFIEKKSVKVNGSECTSLMQVMIQDSFHEHAKKRMYNSLLEREDLTDYGKEVVKQLIEIVNDTQLELVKRIAMAKRLVDKSAQEEVMMIKLVGQAIDNKKEAGDFDFDCIIKVWKELIQKKRKEIYTDIVAVGDVELIEDFEDTLTNLEELNGNFGV